MMTMMRLLLRFVISVISLTVVTAGIYSDDHWTFSTKLTTDNYAETIQNQIDMDKTVFVRFIASEVCKNKNVER
jgi:hypothetical protein